MKEEKLKGKWHFKRNERQKHRVEHSLGYSLLWHVNLPFPPPSLLFLFSLSLFSQLIQSLLRMGFFRLIHCQRVFGSQIAFLSRLSLVFFPPVISWKWHARCSPQLNCNQAVDAVLRQVYNFLSFSISFTGFNEFYHPRHQEPSVKIREPHSWFLLTLRTSCSLQRIKENNNTREEVEEERQREMEWLHKKFQEDLKHRWNSILRNQELVLLPKKSRLEARL